MYLCQHLATGFLTAAALPQSLFGIAICQFNQATALTSLRDQHRHLAAMPFGQPFRKRGHPFDDERQNDLVGDRQIPIVESRQEIRQELIFIELPGQIISTPRRQLPLAVEKHDDFNFPTLTADPHHIPVNSAITHGLLLLHGRFNRPDLVTQQGRCLILLPARGELHALSEHVNHFTLSAFDQGHHAIDQFAVIFGTDQPVAGGTALANLMEETRPTALPACCQWVMPQREYAVNFLEGLTQCGR